MGEKPAIQFLIGFKAPCARKSPLFGAMEFLSNGPGGDPESVEGGGRLCQDLERESGPVDEEHLQAPWNGQSV